MILFFCSLRVVYVKISQFLRVAECIRRGLPVPRIHENSRNPNIAPDQREGISVNCLGNVSFSQLFNDF